MPSDISLKIQDGAKLFNEHDGLEAMSTDYRLSNGMLMGDLHSVSIDLTKRLYKSHRGR